MTNLQRIEEALKCVTRCKDNLEILSKQPVPSVVRAINALEDARRLDALLQSVEVSMRLEREISHYDT